MAKQVQKAHRKPVTKASKKPAKLLNVWQLTKLTANTLWQHRRLFIGITAIYALANILLVQGLSSGADIAGLKHNFEQTFVGHFSELSSSLGTFAILVGTAGGSSIPGAAAYQIFLPLIGSLAIIWALRRVKADATLRIRDAYYQGMYPLVPFILVLVVIGLELLPLLIASGVYNLVIGNNIAVNVIEKIIWTTLFVGFSSLTLYWLGASLFALYIVTLPDMTPLKALRSANQLVRGRRWPVLRKLLFLPLVLLIVAAIIMLPVILWLTAIAQAVFFVLTVLALTYIHAYMYTLYRELLDE